MLVNGFDSVAAWSEISIGLPGVLMLGQNTRNTVSVGVRLEKVGDPSHAYIYNPQEMVLLQTHPYSPTPLITASIAYADTNRVGSPTVFTLTVQPTITIDSYFAIIFPSGAIHDQVSIFSPVCLNASRVDVYHRSDIVRIHPLTPHPAGTSLTYTITNFPSVQYAQYATHSVTIEAYAQLRQVHTETISHTFASFACVLPMILVSVSSPYAGDINVTYSIEVTLPTHQDPSRTLSLTIPSSYESLISTGASCEATVPASCTISGGWEATVTNLPTNSTRMVVTLYGVFNPASGNHTFTATTYPNFNTTLT